MTRSRIALAPIILFGLIVLFQYFGAEKFINPETGRKARVALSPEQESALGLQSYREVLAGAKVLTSGPEVERVERVARRLAAATGPIGAEFDWQVTVVSSPQINAFCLPGGKIVVYTGILPVAKTEAGLAAVLGHEMAHATSRHSSQRVFQHQLAQTVLQGAQFSLQEMDPRQRQTLMGLLGAGTQFGVLLPFGRDHETEADLIGLKYMTRAGFDPREAISFWERMEEASQGRQPPEFMSTHPSHGTRIARIKEALPQVLAESGQAERTESTR